MSNSMIPYLKSDLLMDGFSPIVDWATRLSISCYGVRVGIRLNDSQTLSRVTELLPFGWKMSSTSAVQRVYSLITSSQATTDQNQYIHQLYADDELIHQSNELEETLDRLESHLRLYVAEMTTQRVFVHAGVVGYRNKAIIIPGRSFSGKTTLVAELVKLGAIYYSDEYAVLDHRGLVHPFLKPLAIRAPNEAKQTNYSVESLGGIAGNKPLPVGLVVVSKYRPGAKWKPARLTTGAGLMALLDNTVPARRQPQVVLDSLNCAVSSALTIKGTRGEAQETAQAILDFLRLLDHPPGIPGPVCA